MTVGTRPKSPVAPSWSDLGILLGSETIADVQRAIAAHPAQERSSSHGTTIRHFFGWLTKDTHEATHAVIASLRAGEPDAARNHRAAQMLTHLMERYTEEAKSKRFWTLSTISDYGSRAGDVLQWLGELPDRDYPRFRRQSVSFPKHAGKVPCLGALAWPEIEHLSGVQRERRAMELVRAAALDNFTGLEALFIFGQSLLETDVPPVGVNTADWHFLKAFLELEIKSWANTGRSQFDKHGAMIQDIPGTMERLGSWKTWASAGLQSETVKSLFRQPKRQGRFRSIAGVVLACIGPTRNCLVAATVVFCCDTGWNKQPILTLPRKPVVLRTSSTSSIASSVFLSSFKNRAKHDVFAYLERDEIASGMQAENIRADWDETVRLIDPLNTGDGYATLARDSSLLSVLDRFAVIADAARVFDKSNRYADDAFFYLTPDTGLFRTNKAFRLHDCTKGSLRLPEGVSFQSIRKSFLVIKHRDLGSFAALRPVAGHKGTGILMAHYVDSTTIVSEQEESIRFFQNSLQSEIFRHRSDGHTVLGMSHADFDWWLNMAWFSGIAPALAPDPRRTPRSKAAPKFSFEPVEANLRDLFLAHWALREAQRRLAPPRWRIQGLPLLAMVKAIGRTLCAKGFRTTFVAAARRAHRDLVAGAICLPAVLPE